LKKKGKGARQVIIGIVAGVEEMNSQFETTFSMPFFIFSYYVVISPPI
jgi:hypothetical protein